MLAWLAEWFVGMKQLLVDRVHLNLAIVEIIEEIQKSLKHDKKRTPEDKLTQDYQT